MANRTKVFVILLVLLVVVLAGSLLFVAVIKPAVSGYATQKQTEGVQIAVNSILLQIQQNGFVQIPVGNQTLVLVPYTQGSQSQNTQTQPQPPVA